MSFVRQYDIISRSINHYIQHEIQLNIDRVVRLFLKFNEDIPENRCGVSHIAFANTMRLIFFKWIMFGVSVSFVFLIKNSLSVDTKINASKNIFV